MSRYVDFERHADLDLLMYERRTALFVRFCSRCNVGMSRMVDAFIRFCLPRVVRVQYDGMPREVIDYPGLVAYVNCVESLGLHKSVWNDFESACPEYEEWYHYETVVFERLIEKRKIEVNHSDRVMMQRDSINFMHVLKDLED